MRCTTREIKAFYVRHTVFSFFIIEFAPIRWKQKYVSEKKTSWRCNERLFMATWEWSFCSYVARCAFSAITIFPLTRHAFLYLSISSSSTISHKDSSRKNKFNEANRFHPNIEAIFFVLACVMVKQIVKWHLISIAKLLRERKFARRNTKKKVN